MATSIVVPPELLEAVREQYPSFKISQIVRIVLEAVVDGRLDLVELARKPRPPAPGAADR